MLTLKERLSYLARAVMCMRSDKVGYAPHLGVFLKDLEDKLDMAQVQEQVLNAVINIKTTQPNAEQAITTLNSGLYDLTQVRLIIVFKSIIHSYFKSYSCMKIFVILLICGNVNWLLSIVLVILIMP